MIFELLKLRKDNNVLSWVSQMHLHNSKQLPFYFYVYFEGSPPAEEEP